MSIPEPEVYKGPSKGCPICAHSDCRDWIAASLEATFAARAPRWPQQALRRRIVELFDLRVGKDKLYTHLEQHEPSWKRWDGSS